MEISLIPEPIADVSIDHTERIICALKAKVKANNESSAKRVTFAQLKEVYIEGAKIRVEEKTLNESGMARVNMFLRLISGASIAKEFNVSRAKTVEPHLDFSQYLNPSNGDYECAAKDIKDLDLSFDYQSLDELYLETAACYLGYLL